MGIKSTVVLLIFMCLMVLSSKADSDSPYMIRMNALLSVYSHCDRPKLALAIIQVESNYRNVVSTEGSTGLMQVKPETAKWLKCAANTRMRLLIPDSNIKCGCFYLAKIHTRYSALLDQIAAYNAGSARRCKTGILNPSGKSCIVNQYINQDYVNKVMKELQ